MGGEGSMKAMNDSIKANRKQRRKKSFFSKDRSFLNRKNEYAKLAGGEANLNALSKEELAELKAKIIENNKRDDFIILAIILIFSVFFIYVLYAFVNPFNETRTPINNEQIQKELAEKKEKYNYFISDGDYYLEKGKFHNAIFQYKKAIEVFPKDYHAHYRHAYALTYRCRNENDDCDKAKEKVLKLLEKFPYRSEVQELFTILIKLE